MLGKRIHLAAHAAVLALAVAACDQGFFHEPGAGSASIVLAFATSSAATSAGGPGAAFDKADHVRIRILARDETRLNTTLPIGAAGQNLLISLDVPLRQEVETLTLDVELARDNAPLFRGSAPVQLQIGGTSSVSLTLEAIPHALVLPPLLPTLTAYGDSVRALAAVIFATDDTLSLGPPLWSSLDPTIVAIQGGVPVARADGTARLVGRIGALEDTTTVRVQAIVVSIQIEPNVTILPLGSSRQYTARLLDRRGNSITGRTVQWSSSNPAIVSVNPTTGLATGVSNGSAILTATSDGVSGTLTVQVGAAAPTVTTEPVTNITLTSATLRATVTPNGAATQTRFEYATDAAFANALTTGVTQLPVGSAPVPVTTPVSSLSPGTLYYVRAVASNSAGTTTGNVVTFTTLHSPPIIVSLLARSTPPNALVVGEFIPGSAPTMARFDWGTDPSNLNNSTPERTFPPGSSIVLLEESIGPLAVGVRYRIRMVARNAGGADSMAIDFVPPAPPPAGSAAVPLTSLPGLSGTTGTIAPFKMSGSVPPPRITAASPSPRSRVRKKCASDSCSSR